MSADPAAPLQASVFNLLNGGLSGVRVYDRVPPNAVFPYVTIGDDHILSEYFGEETFFDAYVQVHVWSRAVGSVEAKTIAGSVRNILDDWIDVTGFNVTVFDHVDTRYMLDKDGKTTHAIVQIHYMMSAT